ncbi:hypothetical protein [Magnetospirillum moscoviense]|nr:hypothetical protein [Magnetospirillum moscoviense]
MQGKSEQAGNRQLDGIGCDDGGANEKSGKKCSGGELKNTFFHNKLMVI